MVETHPLRIVFFGTPQFAVPTFEALLRSRHPIVAVITQPDRARGRGQRVIDSPIKAAAVAAGTSILQPARLSDQAFLETLAACRADLGVVAAYGRILTERVLATPRLGMVNVHASLLPRYRGAAPVHRAIIAGETETGVTIMRVVKALDAGPMLAKGPRPIAPDETSEDVERDLALLGASLLMPAIESIAEGHALETPQDDAQASYAHRLTKEDGIIDWRWPAARVHNLIRGLHPWPRASASLHGQRLILLKSATQAGRSDGLPGTIVAADPDSIIVATGEGLLHILQLQPEGKRPMTAAEFLAGHRVAAGERFEAP